MAETNKNIDTKNLIVLANKFTAVKPMPKNEEILNKKTGQVKWGKKDDYGYRLIDLYNGSAWHQGIVKGKTHYIAGGGLEVVSGDLDDWLENSPSAFNMNEVFEGLAFDGELFSKIHVKGTWNLTGTKVVYWEHMDSDMLRSNQDETMFTFSTDHTKSQQSLEKTGWYEIPGLDMNNRTGSFILAYKEPFKRTKGDLGVYGKPGYVGGITSIQTDVNISEYHLKEIENGFKLGTIINLANGVPEGETAKKKAGDEARAMVTDMDNTGGIGINFSDGDENKVSVVHLNGNDLDKRYLMTEKSVQQNILVSHSVTSPMLFGIKTEGQLGGASEVQVSYEILKNTYVNTKQKRLESLAQIMIDLSGFVGEVKLKDAPIIGGDGDDNQVTEKINSLSPLVATKVLDNLTTNQIIGLVGLPPIEGGDVIPDKTGLKALLQKHGKKFEEAADLEEAILKAFGEVGTEKGDIAVFNRTGLTPENIEDLENFEGSNVASYFDIIGTISASLSDLDKQVLKLISEDNDIINIAEALDEKVGDVAKSMKRLTDLDLLDKSKSTDLGNDIVNEVSGDAGDFTIVYSYEVRDGYGAEIIDGTREFCEKLIKLDRFYTRDEISQISAAVDRDVWNFRGGWFNDNGVNTPWCRHEWVQQLIIK